MALKTNAVLTFTGYTVVDTVTTLKFVCADPGAGQPSDYSVDITDAEAATAVSGATFLSLVQAKLNRKYRATGLASFLDARIGGTITV